MTMSLSLSLVTLVVPDYNAGIAFYCDVLGFTLAEDTDLGHGKRWVRVMPHSGTGFLLAKASGETQQAAIGNQTGDRVAFFLQTDDFAGDYHRFQTKGVHFLEPPRYESYGSVVVFQDPFGNKFDLIEPKKSQRS